MYAVSIVVLGWCVGWKFFVFCCVTLQAFGVLQSRFAVVRYPALTWSKSQIWEVMTCCIILHNMIIESEQKEPVFDTEPYYRQGPFETVDHQVPTSWAAFLNMRQEIRDPQVHQELHHDLVEHL
ncbi:hypothetical protein VPH35_059980 [Triticum aestivum]